MTQKLNDPVEEEIEDDDVFDVDPSKEILPIRYSITSYGADFLVDGLIVNAHRK